MTYLQTRNDSGTASAWGSKRITRATSIATLAFSVLFLGNLAIFGRLIFGDISEAMVTGKLVDGLREAEDLWRTRTRASESNVDSQEEVQASKRWSRQLAPRLREHRYLRAIVVLDKDDQVIHRETVWGGVFGPSSTPAPNQASAALQPSIEFNATDKPADLSKTERSRNPVRAEKKPDFAVKSASESERLGLATLAHFHNKRDPSQPPASEPSRVAIEYDAEQLEYEVRELRQELNLKLMIAIAISAGLLALAFLYVLWANRRHRLLKEQAERADRLAYVGTLASGLAHEIRNPLNSMNMNVQLIQEEISEQDSEQSGELVEMLEATRKEILRLERLVSSFLAYARPPQLQLKPNSVNQLLTETLDFLEREIQKSGIRLEKEFEAGLPEIPLDEGQMRQALLNVIQNAVQVLQPGKALQIRTRRAGGDNLIVQIKDEGPGISEQELTNIFKAFYSTKRGGSGLGLPIAQRIVELHGGGIKVESQVGIGTQFTIVLPFQTNS